MNRFLFRLDHFALGELILSLIVLVCMLASLYGVVSLIHTYIGDWYFIACAISMIFFLRMAKNAPLESELWPDKD